MTTEDKFGGDYDKLLKSYNDLQSLVGKQSNQIADLTTKTAEYQSTIQDLQTAKSQLETDMSAGGSLYDWANGNMRTGDGSVDPGLVSAMEKLGASPDQTKALVENVEFAHKIIKEREEASIRDSFGSRDNYDAALVWANDNLDESKVSAINTLLGDRSTAEHGLSMLRSEAESGGLSFRSNTNEDKKVDEPSKLPQSTASGGGGLTPLRPYTQEAKDAMKEAFASGDPDKVKEYEARLMAGMKSG